MRAGVPGIASSMMVPCSTGQGGFCFVLKLPAGRNKVTGFAVLPSLAYCQNLTLRRLVLLARVRRVCRFPVGVVDAKSLFHDQAEAGATCCLVAFNLAFLRLSAGELPDLSLGDPGSLQVAKCHGLPFHGLGAMISGNFLNSFNKRSGAVTGSPAGKQGGLAAGESRLSGDMTFQMVYTEPTDPKA
jgi:hypothetical protein